MGFGNIGLELAKRLRPFGVRIIATKRSWAQNSSQLNGNKSDQKMILLMFNLLLIGVHTIS